MSLGDRAGARWSAEADIRRKETDCAIREQIPCDRDNRDISGCRMLETAYNDDNHERSNTDNRDQ